MRLTPISPVLEDNASLHAKGGIVFFLLVVVSIGIIDANGHTPTEKGSPLSQLVERAQKGLAWESEIGVEEIVRFIARDARGNPFFLVVYHNTDVVSDKTVPVIKTLDGSIVQRLGRGIYQIPAFDAVYVTSDDPRAL